MTFKNHQAEIASRFYLYMENVNEEGPSFYLHSQGLTMAKDEVSTRRFFKTAVYAPQIGQYRLHVLYAETLFSDRLVELLLPEEKIITIMRASDILIASNTL